MNKKCIYPAMPLALLVTACSANLAPDPVPPPSAPDPMVAAPMIQERVIVRPVTALEAPDLPPRPVEVEPADRVPERNMILGAPSGPIAMERPVVVTRTGKDYHRPDCPTLNHSAGEFLMVRRLAMKNHYLACRVCKPDQPR